MILLKEALHNSKVQILERDLQAELPRLKIDLLKEAMMVLGFFPDDACLPEMQLRWSAAQAGRDVEVELDQFLDWIEKNSF